MSQTRFSFISITPEKKKNLEQTLGEIYHTIKNKFKSFETFQKVLLESSTFASQDLKDEQAPEEFTKRYVIEPLIEFLGFEIVAETVLASPEGRREPDYKIRPEKRKEPMFYVEAEPINIDLYSKGHGKSQVDNWLLSRVSETDYGMATDGLKWIIFKFDTASAKSKVLDLKIDFRPFFVKMLNPHSFTYANEIERAEEDFLKLDCEIISIFLSNYLEKIEKNREEITKRFYNDYVKYVFGVDEEGNTAEGVCLLNKVLAPPNTTKKEVNLFSVVFMNRLIFMKFLEEKKIIPKDFLKKLNENYKSSGAPSSFYETYLKPLFYEVFNKNKNERISRVRSNPFYSDVPYLNSGLFREVVSSEKNYTVENEGVELILEYIEKYSFSSESGIDPDILGYIFERTINFISGTGTNQQKMQGAYYTPDDVVEFIIEQTLIPTVFKKMIEGLKDSGWKEADLKGYESINDLLSPQNMPKNPIHVRKMVEAIDSVKVLDPACGSGHFLTAALSEILRIKENLLRTIGEDVQRYDLKRSIVSKNLFGVDIDQDAVEIARLRLWLSIIDEVTDSKHTETLPNIDFNIVTGNTLIGWLDETLLTHPLINLLDDQEFKNALDILAESSKGKVDKVRELLGRMKLEDTVEAYRNLVETYSLESGEQAVKLRDVLERIRNKLYEVITHSYLDFLHEKSSLGKTDFEQIDKDMTNRIPLHWKIDFQSVLHDGGFDVVIGNPPYIEDNMYNKTDLKIVVCDKKKKRTKNKETEALVYYSRDCGNTHAYFIERSIRLLKPSGSFAFIVPISLVSTDRMRSIRQFIHQNSSEAKYFNFDDRPGKIFSGIEHCRSTIVVTRKGKGIQEIKVSKYNRWFSENRHALFENLKTVDWSLQNSGEVLPKIGTNIEKKTLEKMAMKSSGKTVGDFVKETGLTIWYHNAPQYWIHAHTENYLPKIEYYKGYKRNKNTGEIFPANLKNAEVSSHYKSISVSPEHAPIVLGLLNSSLFYWWFIVWSDGRDLLTQHVNSFFINLEKFPKNLKERLKPLTDELMTNYEDTSNLKVNVRKGDYAVKIKEILPQKSKSIIDKIDDVFAEYFEFNDKEKNFIGKFDIEFKIAGR